MQKEIKRYDHQIEAANHAKGMHSFGLLWEMGTGKTLGIIDIMRNAYRFLGEVAPTVILGPTSVMYNWRNELLQFTKIDKSKVIVLEGSGKKKAAHVAKLTEEETKAVVILNYEALLNKDLFEALMEFSPKVVVGDEMHLIKTYNSKRAVKTVKLADKARELGGFVYGLTGTLILNSVADVYMQFRFLDGGARFGRSFFAFRAAFMEDKNIGWSSSPKHFPKWVTRESKIEEMNEKIYSICSRVEKNEVLKDLPPFIKVRRSIEMTKEMRSSYKCMEKEFFTFINGKAVVANIALTKALRLMQICSGFATDDDGEVTEFKVNPKIKELKELLLELTPKHKVIVWCSFKNNYKQIAALCKDQGIGHEVISGADSTKEKEDKCEVFRKTDDCRVMIANRKAAGTGINLVEASYSVVFSRNFSLAEELQSEARNYRGGSQMHDKVTKIDLIVKDSIEETLVDVLNGKEKLSDTVLAEKIIEQYGRNV